MPGTTLRPAQAATKPTRANTVPSPTKWIGLRSVARRHYRAVLSSVLTKPAQRPRTRAASSTLDPSSKLAPAQPAGGQHVNQVHQARCLGEARRLRGRQLNADAELKLWPATALDIYRERQRSRGRAQCRPPPTQWVEAGAAKLDATTPAVLSPVLIKPAQPPAQGLRVRYSCRAQCSGSPAHRVGSM